MGEISMFNNNNIKNIRLANSKNQEDIAALLNIKRSSYAMWESGNEIFPIKRLIAFCEQLNVSVDYALGLTSKNNYNLNKYNKDKSILRLKEFRKEFNLTQEKLASILNTNKSVICSYEKGRYIIATPFLYTICQKYKVSADYLLGKTDKPKYLK